MILEKILKLGNPALHKVALPVTKEELPKLQGEVETLFSIIAAYRKQYNAGRGVAAPQIGILKRIICLDLEGSKYVIINPVLSNLSDAQFTLWDDCMCFPNLLVKVKRHKACTVTYKDAEWNDQKWNITDPRISELVQHEYDHLEGVLATQRAVDRKSFKYVTSKSS